MSSEENHPIIAESVFETSLHNRLQLALNMIDEIFDHHTHEQVKNIFKHHQACLCYFMQSLEKQDSSVAALVDESVEQCKKAAKCAKQKIRDHTHGF